MASAVKDRAAIMPRPPTRSQLVIGAMAGALLTILLVIAVEMFLLLQQMRQLERELPGSSPSATQLGAVRSDLDRMQPDLHQMTVQLRQVQSSTVPLDPSLRDLSAKVGVLDSDISQVLAVLRDIDEHVASIDRKTGPALPLH